MRSFLIVLITVCVLGLGFGVYWMFAGTGEAPEAEAGRQRTRRLATTLPTASDSVVGPGRKVYVLRFDQKTGELASRFRAARYEPQKGGRWHVTEPEAEFFLHNGQVLRIIGEKGTVNVDDQGLDAGGEVTAMKQMPRGGELQNVRLLLLPSAGATRPTMTLTMKNASFDNETFRISTEAYRDGDRTVPADRVHVKVRGDDYEFDGYGLRLQYNELDRRLELLRITHGERLLIKRPAKFMQGRTLGAKDQTQQAARDAHQTPAELVPWVPMPSRAVPGVRLVAADDAAVAEAVKPSKKPRKVDDPLDEPAVQREEPVYRATFKDAVNITQSGKQLAVAQDLVVDFLNDDDQSLGGVVGGERNPTTRPRRSTTRPTTRQARAQPATRPATSRPATNPASEPIEIRWTGSLTIAPLPGDRPERIAPGESIVRLVSAPKRPVEVTRQSETGTGILKAGVLTHWTIDQGVLLEEAPGIPVEMIDSKGSHIRTQSMRFSERDGVAMLQGKSRALLPVLDEKSDPEAEEAAEEPKRQYMDVAWQERCTLFLAGGGLDDMILSRADLQGRVAVDHPQLKLQSQALQLLFDEQHQPATQPAQTDATPRSTPPLRQLDAAGDVHCVITRPDKTEQTLDCQSLKLLTARTATGQLFARSIVALGQVHAVDPKQDVRAGYVSVSLAAPPTTRPTTRPAAGEMMPGEVESLLAHDNVFVKTVDGKTAEADQLVVEIRDGQPSATLHGRPAVVTHDRNKLSADAIQMMSGSQQISVPGPGRMEGVQRQEPGKPERPLEVTWETNMRADGRRNTIEAFGGVVARTVGADGAVNVAKGDQVRLTTTRPTKPAAVEGDASRDQSAVAAAPEPASKKPTTRPTGDLDVMADHQIQSILLQDGAQVTSILTEGGGERMFHVTSASIQYDKAKQKLTIPQDGKLLFADSRPPAKTDAAQAAAQDPFGVRGRTAFEWAESLVYDEAANQVTMTGDVVIARLEQSQSDDDRLRIEADRVIADLEPAKPTTRPAGDDLLAPRMQLKHVRAAGRVLVNSKRLHVRAETLEFDPVRHVLTVRGSKDQPVEQLDDNGLPGTTFDELTYNTKTGDIKSKNPTFRNRQTGASSTPARVLPGAR